MCDVTPATVQGGRASPIETSSGIQTLSQLMSANVQTLVAKGGINYLVTGHIPDDLHQEDYCLHHFVLARPSSPSGDRAIYLVYSFSRHIMAALLLNPGLGRELPEYVQCKVDCSNCDLSSDILHS